MEYVSRVNDAITLEDLDPVADRPVLEALWEAALAPTWPLLPAGLGMIEAGLVARERGTPLGAVAVDPHGCVPLLLVDPARQRRGIGSMLLDAALRRLAGLGVRTVGLGSGGRDYIWPGVPENLQAAAAFFSARGWDLDDTVTDLVGDLRDYRTPDGVHERAAREGVRFEIAGAPDRAELLAFEAANFPQWLRYFERGDGPVLLARDRDGLLAGALIFGGPDAGHVFAPLLGPAAGTIGCVGVADRAQGRGIGTAMVATASELLHDAGVQACHIGWTVRYAFYGRLGYTPWRRYRMSRRRLSEQPPTTTAANANT